MRILITGGAGAIGSNIANALSKNPNLNVVILDNLSSGHLKNIQMASNVTFVHGSVESDEDLNRAFVKKFDTIFHLAANFANQNSVDFPQRDLQVNGAGTLKLLLRAQEQGVKRFVYSSSSCVYGNRAGPLDEKCKEFSLDTPYAITKLLGERYVNFFHKHYGLKTVILRYFNVYGPNEYPGKYRNVIANFLHKAMRNEDILITGNGDETRDFSFSQDTVQATILASEAPGAIGNVLNIASGKETKIRDLVAMIIHITKSQSKVWNVEKRDWDSVTRRVASIESTKDILNFQPSYNLETGIEVYYQWMKDQNLQEYEWGNDDLCFASSL